MNIAPPKEPSVVAEKTTTEQHIETQSALPVVPQLLLLAAFMVLIFSGTVTPKILSLFETRASQEALLGAQELAPSQAKSVVGDEPFENISIAADAAYVFDIQNQKALFKKEESKQLPLASITKLMTALVAQEVLGETETVAIGAQALSQSGESGFTQGELFDRLSLSDLVLMASSNDGAFALAAAAGKSIAPEGSTVDTFVRAMNVRAQELGLKETYFKNPTGLDISSTEGGAYGSARDVAFLMEYIVKNELDILSYTTTDTKRVYSESGEFHDAENTNEYVAKIPGLIGSKTGYTDLAGGNLVVAFNAGLSRPIVVVVLGSTQHERFTDILTLVEETQAYITATIKQ